MPREKDFKQTLYADIDGLSLHAAVHCDADDPQGLDNEALMAMLPVGCDRQAWRKCFEDCRTMQTHPDSLKGRVAGGGSE